MDNKLRKMLSPESVAIIGASPDPGSVGGLVLNYLLKYGYKGKIYPVNPKYDEMKGMPCYSSIKDLPEAADTAFLAIPGRFVIPTIKDCAERGVETAIISSSGFAEMGGEGKKLQNDLRDLIRQSNMSVCGPNCNGIVNFHENATLCFSRFLDADDMQPGNIGFVTQSGALGGSLVDRARDKGMGFTYYIAPGNEVDADIVDYMSFLVDDPKTEIIAAYIEQIRDTKQFSGVARRALEKGKPIVVLKVGTTEAGAKAAASHTGALAGSDKVYDAFLKQNGVIRVDDYEDLIETTMLLSRSRLPQGGRVGILSVSGGGAIMLADRLEEYGMSMATLTERTKEGLAELLPSFANVGNPMDLTWGAGRGGNEEQQKMFRIFAEDENVDIVISMLTMVAGERAAQRAKNLVVAADAVDSTFVNWWAAGNLAAPGMKVLDESRISLFRSPERCVRALKLAVNYSKFRKDYIQGLKNVDNQSSTISDENKSKAKEIVSKKGNLTEHGAKVLLSCYGIPVSTERVATSSQEAVEIAEGIGYPVVLKISSPQIMHKSEAGGIKLNVGSKEDVVSCYEEIIKNAKKYDPKADLEGVLIQEMISGGTEVMVGISKDPGFGPVIMFGLGGIYVEILKDVSMRVLPVSRSDIQEMIGEIKGIDILKGARGKGKADIDAITDLLMNMSSLAMDLSEDISEVDLNPVVVFEDGKGLKAVDALVVKAR